MAELPDPVVRCEGVTKYFGGVRALDRVSLDFHSGEVVCLVGENGAGKSTLVRILSGAFEPDEGAIWLGQERRTRLDAGHARRWGIETVHQHLALCDNLGAAANVTLGQEPTLLRLGPVRLVDKKTSRKLTERLVSEIGVALPSLDEPVRRFSGGERQAIAIARAMVHGHRLIMFDEPTAAMGVRQKRATLELVRRVADRGVAVLLISHNMDEVFAVGDRIVVLRLGAIVLNTRAAEASPETVVSAMAGLQVT